MRSIEEAALLSPWRERTVEVGFLCAGLAACAVSIPSVRAGLGVLAVVVALATAAEVPWRPYLRKLAAASGFAFVSILPMAVGFAFHPRRELSFDPDGFQTAVLAGTRAIATLSVTLLLVHTTPFPRLLALLRRLRLPEVLLELLALVHREIFLLDETFSRLRKALACRDGGRGRMTGVRALGLGSAVLFVQALRRSERVERGLASRGGAGTARRWEEPLSIRTLPLLGSLAAPAVLAVWIVGGRLGL